MAIHPTSIIDPSATIADDCHIGPGVVIGPDSFIGSGVELGPHVVIGPNTTIRENARIFTGAVIGNEPQDFKFDGSLTTCEVGPRTIIREYCTISRGTNASRATIVGSDCMFMAYSHVAHDCRIGNNVVVASTTLFGGHCEVEDKATIGGSSAFHQFTRVGKLAMVGGMSGVRQDCPPYMITSGGPPAVVYSLNAIGLRRNGISPENRKIIREAFGFLYRSGLNTKDALTKIETELEQIAEIVHLLGFYKKTKRGVARGHRPGLDADDEELVEQAGKTARLA